MFEIKNENQNGIFHVKLNRSLSSKEIMDIAQIAANVVGSVQSDVEALGKILPMEESPTFIGQNKLGEKPVDKINLGEYKEPDTGVRIRMLAFPEQQRVSAIRAMRELTGISLVGCKDVLYGNFKCPVLTRDVAVAILGKLKELGIYASLMDGQC